MTAAGKRWKRQSVQAQLTVWLDRRQEISGGLSYEEVVRSDEAEMPVSAEIMRRQWDYTEAVPKYTSR